MTIHGAPGVGIPANIVWDPLIPRCSVIEYVRNAVLPPWITLNPTGGTPLAGNASLTQTLVLPAVDAPPVPAGSQTS